ncbi:GNAT family N-acetyltransferase [Lacipirellula sp.]|uniref:GNAT family N-acetyltransferase n=1 Tax=Lacipirellula sp. TaxID=2691419 RepID=UPI003D12A858
MSSPSPAPSVAAGVAKIRPLGPEDIGHVRAMLAKRDGHAWDERSTAWFLHGLDPQRCMAWGAFVGDKPVGLTSMFLRTLSVNGGTERVAYWANLYVDPDYRDQMLYPRLPMTMLTSLKSLGIEMLYAPVRLPQLTKAHLGLGFAKVGAMEVLVRPLRPARFICKYKRIGWARPLAGPVDAAFGAVLALTAARPVAGTRIDDGSIEQRPVEQLEAVAALIGERSAGRIAQLWSAELLQQRYGQTREGGSYRLATAWRGDTLQAAAIYRFAERGDGIQVGVLMDFAFREGAEADGAAVLRAVEKATLAAGGELLLYLDGLGDANRQLLKRRGFRSSPENYEFLVWPKKLATAEARFGDWDRWAFSFRDHDAF